MEVTLPKLEGLPYSVGGDWGPNFLFKLKASDPVRIRYDTRSYILEASTLMVESPMLFEIRDQWPFCLLIWDPVQDARFGIYVDRNGALGRVEINHAGNASRSFGCRFVLEFPGGCHCSMNLDQQLTAARQTSDF